MGGESDQKLGRVGGASSPALVCEQLQKSRCHEQAYPERLFHLAQRARFHGGPEGQLLCVSRTTMTVSLSGGASLVQR